MYLPKRQPDTPLLILTYWRLDQPTCRLYDANSNSSKIIWSQLVCRAAGVFGASVSIRLVSWGSHCESQRKPRTIRRSSIRWLLILIHDRRTCCPRQLSQPPNWQDSPFQQAFERPFLRNRYSDLTGTRPKLFFHGLLLYNWEWPGSFLIGHRARQNQFWLYAHRYLRLAFDAVMAAEDFCFGEACSPCST